MECNVVKDLIPLYIDECCSEESREIVAEHIKSCASCKKLFEDMKAPPNMVQLPKSSMTISKLNDWKASVMQSVLLFLSFAVITVGVALEAKSPSGLTNGFWALNLVVPAAGFLLSLANWYFIRLYKSRKCFSVCSFIATLGITICAYIWAGLHYEINIFKLFTEHDAVPGIGLILTAVFCVLSKTLSTQYAKMLGKE